MDLVFHKSKKGVMNRKGKNQYEETFTSASLGVINHPFCKALYKNH